MACFFIATAWSNGGISGHFRAIANGLVERGHTVVILTDRLFVVEDGVGNPALYGWPSPRPTHVRDFVFFLRLVRRYRPDVLIANFGAGNVMTIGGWLARVPTRILWYHTLSTQLAEDSPDPDWKRRALMARKRPIYRLATRVVANSAAARADAERTYGIPSSRTAYFHYLLADPLAVLPSSTDEPRSGILCVGRLNISKGQDTVIRALALIKDDLPTITVEFIGDGPFLDSLVDLARDLDVLDRCVFAGRLTHEQVLAKMRAARLTLVPSRNEAFGLVVAESLAVGTPVIGSNVGGIREIVRDTLDGFLVPVADAAALADRMACLLRDDGLWQAMNQQARQRFLQAFESSAAVGRLLDWLEARVKPV